MASPPAIQRLLDKCVRAVDGAYLAGHYHDTGGQALANITASLPYGIRCFDASVGGLGGCPYAPGAAGNVASEAVAEMLSQAGFATGLDHDALESRQNLPAAFASHPPLSHPPIGKCLNRFLCFMRI